MEQEWRPPTTPQDFNFNRNSFPLAVICGVLSGTAIFRLGLNLAVSRVDTTFRPEGFPLKPESLFGDLFNYKCTC